MTFPLTGGSVFVKIYYVIFYGMKKEKIYKEGVVLENLPSTLFRVKMDDGREILAHLSGRMRVHYIRVLPGDRVRLEMTPYDETKGRIVHRLK